MGSAKGSTTKESSSKLDDANAIVARIVMNIRKQTEELKNGRG